jgi:hypothetical protein
MTIDERQRHRPQERERVGQADQREKRADLEPRQRRRVLGSVLHENRRPEHERDGSRPARNQPEKLPPQHRGRH